MDYSKIIEKIEPQKVYTYSEIVKTISPTQPSTGAYVLNDFLAAGRIVECLHPILSVRGYKLKQ